MPGFSRSLAELAELAGGALDARATQVLLRAFSELHEELADQVTKAEFRELTAVVQELAEAQKRTEQRLDRLEQIVAELAEAQKRTEQRVEELAAAQKRTEQRVEELAAAQRRTEETVRRLVVDMEHVKADMKHVKEELGGLSHAVGYGLENLAYRTLPHLLQQRFDLTVGEPLRRRFLSSGRRQLEVNIWGLATRPDGQKVRLVGEAKTRLSAAKHFKQVDRLLAATRPHWGAEEAFVVLVCHVALPGTEEEARQRGWWVVESWELESAPAA